MAKKPAPPEKSDPHTRIRMLGERDESITISLSDGEVADQRTRACDLRDQIDALEDKIKSVKVDFKAKQDDLEQQERVARRLASTRRAEVDVKIQEWLTRGNEVVRVNASTGEQLGPPRTARAAELQESLPFDDSGGDDSPGDPFEAA